MMDSLLQELEVFALGDTSASAGNLNVKTRFDLP